MYQWSLVLKCGGVETSSSGASYSSVVEWRLVAVEPCILKRGGVETSISGALYSSVVEWRLVAVEPCTQAWWSGD